MNSPCAKDCPNRCATCHITCVDYVNYVALNKATRDRNKSYVIAARNYRERLFERQEAARRYRRDGR